MTMFEIFLIIALLVIIFYLYGFIRELMKLQIILIELKLEVNRIGTEINDIKKTVTNMDTYARYGSVENFSNYEDGLKNFQEQKKKSKKRMNKLRKKYSLEFQQMFQKKTNPPKRTLADLLNDKSVLTGREVVQRIKDKEILRKQFEEAVEFEVMNRRK